MRKFADKQTIREHTLREFKNWGHSNPLWIVGVSGQISIKEKLTNSHNQNTRKLCLFLSLEWLCLHYFNLKNSDSLYIINTIVLYIAYSVEPGWSLTLWTCQTFSYKYSICQQMTSCTFKLQYQTVLNWPMLLLSMQIILWVSNLS